MATKKRTIPQRAFDGDWWKLPVYVPYECPNCGKTTPDRPAIMRYKPEVDFDSKIEDEIVPEHRMWADAGWLLWYACAACGRETHDFTYEYRHSLVATSEQIEDWLNQGTHSWERV